MNRVSVKAIKGIAITLAVLIALAGIILGIIWACLTSGINPDYTYIEYDNLKKVMENDVAYISSDFINENKLEIKDIYWEDAFSDDYELLGNVRIEFNRRKTNDDTDFTERVEDVQYYYYTLINKNQEEREIKVCITGNSKNALVKKDKYDKKYGKYKYYSEEMKTKLNESGERIYTSYYQIKVPIGWFKSSKLEIDIIYKDIGEERSIEEIEQVMDGLFKSAVDNIELYK